MTSFVYEIMLTRGCWFQTLDVNKPWCQIPADRLLFLMFTHYFFLITPRQYEKKKNSFKLNHVIERNFEAANGRITELVQASYKNRKCLGNFPKHVLPYPCYDAKAPRQYPVPLPCTPRCINAVCFGEHIFNSRRSDFTCRTLRGNHSTLIRQRCDNILRWRMKLTFINSERWLCNMWYAHRG